MAKKKEKAIIEFPSHAVELDIERILFNKRQIFLFEKITHRSALSVIKQIKALDALSREPIILWINSYGGNCDAGLAIIDAMKHAKSPIATWITGTACSMASLISIAGNARIMNTNAVWMIHPTTSGVADYVSIVEDRVKGMKLWQTTKKKLLTKYTKLRKKELEKALRGELWLDSKQCLKKGIVDKVIKHRR